MLFNEYNILVIFLSNIINCLSIIINENTYGLPYHFVSIYQ